MRRKNIVTKVILWTVISTVGFPSYSCADESINHLKYFGYYHADMEFDKSTHRGYPANYIESIGKLKNSNVVLFCLWPLWYAENPEVFYDNIKLASKYDMKVILNVYGIFFQWKKNKMYPKWEKRWTEFKKLIKPVESNILGFYIDEPYQTGISEQNFKLATKHIKSDFPMKELITVISVFTLRKGISPSYFEYCTGVGFDYYEGSWRKEDIEKRPQKSYYALFEKLKTQLAPHQKLWVIPKAFRRIDFNSKNKPINEIKNWYKLALKEPRVVGMLNFSFASYWAEYNPIGAHQLFDKSNPHYDDKLKKIHIKIGRSIISSKNCLAK